MQQTQLIAGDSLNFSVSTPGYSPADGWALQYRLVARSVAGSVIDLAAAPAGTVHLVQVAAAITSAWVAGEYTWTSWVSKAGEVYTVASGLLTILPDPRQTVAGYDGRSLAQIALANCEAAMATFNATGGKVKRYEIAGRTMEFQTIGDLMQLHSFWKVKVSTETTASDLAKGLGNPRNLYCRFVRPQ